MTICTDANYRAVRRVRRKIRYLFVAYSGFYILLLQVQTAPYFHLTKVEKMHMLLNLGSAVAKF